MQFALILGAALALAPPSSSEAESKRRVLRVAVYDLDAASVDPRTARVVTDSLLFELRKLERVSVIGFDEIRAMLDLEAEKAAMGCDEESSCLAEIADALGADVLLTGSLAKVGGDHIFGLKALDQREAKAGATFNKIVPAGDGTEFLAEVGPAVEALFPDRPLRAGETRGVNEEAARRLSPPPLPAWVFWGGAGTSAVLLVASAAAGAVQLASYGEYKDLAARSATEDVSGALLASAGDAAVASEVTGWALLGGAVFVGALAAVSYPLTDFDGYGAER
jgi:hypothetical protein